MKALGSSDAWQVGATAGEGWSATGAPMLEGSGVYNPMTGQEFMGQALDPSGMPAREMQYSGGNIWDRLTSSPELSSFYSKKD